RTWPANISAAHSRPLCQRGTSRNEKPSANRSRPSSATTTPSPSYRAARSVELGTPGPSRIPALRAWGRAGVAGISQLADAHRPRAGNDGHVEIRIVLDRTEPPAGRLRVLRAPGQAPAHRPDQDIGFTGWLGLLRALYEVTAEPGEGARSRP